MKKQPESEPKKAANAKPKKEAKPRSAKPRATKKAAKAEPTPAPEPQVPAPEPAPEPAPAAPLIQQQEKPHRPTGHRCIKCGAPACHTSTVGLSMNFVLHCDCSSGKIVGRDRVVTDQEYAHARLPCAREAGWEIDGETGSFCFVRIITASYKPTDPEFVVARRGHRAMLFRRMKR